MIRSFATAAGIRFWSTTAGTLWVRSSERLVYRRKDSPKFAAMPGIPHSPEFGALYQTKDGRLLVPTDQVSYELSERAVGEDRIPAGARVG